MFADRLSMSGKRGVLFESFVVVAPVPVNSTLLQSYSTRKKEWVNEWINKCSEWMNERTNELMMERRKRGRKRAWSFDFRPLIRSCVSHCYPSVIYYLGSVVAVSKETHWVSVTLIIRLFCCVVLPFGVTWLVWLSSSLRNRYVLALGIE
jgi:hypothetical protein